MPTPPRALDPFFSTAHEELAAALSAADLRALRALDGPRAVASHLGTPLGLYRYLVPEALGGAPRGRPGDPTFVDVRALVLIREALAAAYPLADALFAVQGLGAYPIVLAGTPDQQRALLPPMVRGESVGAFALTEPEAGSDVASMRTVAERASRGWRLTGTKTFISNVGIADHFVVFANADPSAGRSGISAFVVEATAPGLALEPIALSFAHPFGRVGLDGVVVPDTSRLGPVGAGFALAMRTLDTFRIGVGAAANGMAGRALELALAHVRARRQFGAPLAEQQQVKAYLAEMATTLEAARLLVAKAAFVRDTSNGRATTEAAMAKMYATEAAQRIIDLAVQLHGGAGVTTAAEVEHLYREIRPLRIYEGTTEIQRLVIAKGLLDAASAEPGRT